MDDEELDTICRETLDALAALRREYERAAEPIIRQLAYIESLRRPKPFIVSAGHPWAEQSALAQYNMQMNATPFVPPPPPAVD